MTVCSGANVLGDLGRVATGASNKLFGRQDTAAPDCTSPQRCSMDSILRSPEDPEGSQNRYCALWRNYDRCHVCALTQGCPTVTDIIAVDRGGSEKHDWHFCTQAEQYDAYEGRHIHNTLHHVENVTLPIAFDNAYEWKRADEEYHFSYKVLRDVFLKNPEKHINFHCTDALRDAACKNATITKSSGLLIKFDEQLEANPALSQCQIEKEKDKQSPPTEVTLASECVWEKGFECGREEGPWNVTLSDLCNPQEDALSRAGDWAKSNAEGAIDAMGAGLSAIGNGFSSWTHR
eukprot:g6088.t1